VATEPKDTPLFARKARPILSQRDYQATKQVLSTHAQTLTPFLEPGRFEGLLRELSAYETHNAKVHPGATGSLSIRNTDTDRQRQRRWSDPTEWLSSNAA
jgi:hypothetical protein